MPGANHTTFVFGAVFAAFLFWITVRGDLGKWLGMLGLAGASKATPGTTTPGVSALPALPTLPSLLPALTAPSVSSGQG